MTKEIVICDRCGAEVKYPLSAKYLLSAKYRIQSKDRTEIDLCQNCIDSFEKWFSKSKKGE